MLRLQRVGGCMQGLGSIKENICYREAVNRAGETERLELDVDLPENDLREAETSVGNSDGADQEGQPVILWVHGGALVTGDKAAYYDPCVELSKKLAAEGYTGVRINYRLNPKVYEDGSYDQTMQEAAEDITAAAEWILQDPEKLGLAGRKLVLAGYSAGAELVTNLYYDSHMVSDWRREQVCGVIDISGNRLFYTDRPLPEAAVPCLVFHGEADDINPPEDTRTFLTQMDGRAQMNWVPDRGHMWTDEEGMALLYERISQYLHEIR